MPTIKRLSALLLMTTLHTSCSTANSDVGAKPDNSVLENLNIVVLQDSASAPIPFGIEEGIFEKHGLYIEIVDSQGGAAMLPDVEAGTFDIGVMSPISVLIAHARGLEMRIVSGFSYAYPAGDDVTGAVAMSEERTVG